MSRLESYRDLYFFLFAALADAVEHLEQGETLLACERLIRAQQETEAAHMEFDLLPQQ